MFDLTYFNNALPSWPLIPIAFLFLVSFFFLFLGLRPKRQNKKIEVAPVVSPQEVVINWDTRLKKGLERSRTDVWGKLFNFFGSSVVTQDQLMEVEEILYSADIGSKLVQEVLEFLTRKVKGAELTSEQIKLELFHFLQNKFSSLPQESSSFEKDLFKFDRAHKTQTQVVMIVGINGVGKTTTIGKLATKLTKQGAKVVVGAGDTFRAAAVDQLQIWCDRAQALMIRAKEGAGPSGVGYQALETALAQGADYCLLDTSGRLHNNENLMEELKKSKNVLKKLMPDAPHQILLVIDAITGQNALKQALEFHKTLQLTGVILTKCDGSSKAGSALAIVEELKVPIVYIGVGEDVSDLDIFRPKEYLEALLGL